VSRGSHPANGSHKDLNLLAIAALFRETFSIDWLVDLLLQLRPSQILGELEDALGKGLLMELGPGVYTFKDAGCRRQYSGQIPLDVQRVWHGRIADILMRELPDDEHKAHEVAHHLIHISNDIEHCRYLARAGDLHLQAFHTEEALQCYLKVLDELKEKRGGEEDRLFSDTAVKYSKISTARHDTTKVLSILQSALQRSQKNSFLASQALLRMHMAKNEWLRSRYRSALRHFEEGWSLAEELNDPRVMRSATTFSTFFLFWQGRFREAVRVYEKSVPDIEKLPRGGFPLLAVMTVGYCYAQIGQVTQGLGMLDAIRSQCMEKGDVYLASYAGANMGDILLNIGRIEEGIQFLEKSAKEARKVHNDWVWITAKKVLAYAYYLKGEKKQTLRYLREFFKESRKVQATVYLYPYLMELSMAMKRGDLPVMEGLSPEKIIPSLIKGKNIFLRGVAQRYQAMLMQMKGTSHDTIIRQLNQSIRLLETSGQQIELSKSRLALARQYLALEEGEKAKELVLIASKTLSSLNETLIPDDLRGLIKDRFAGETLLKEVLNLGQEVVAIRGNKDLVQHILSTGNRITGAERGAIFLLEGGKDSSELILRASKNLTSDQVAATDFQSSIQMIEGVARTGKGRILGTRPGDGGHFMDSELIRSRICVPMRLRDKTVGVLYHDNRLLSSAFTEPDIEILSYFAALAAFSLDNARAYEEIRRLNRKLSEETRYYKEEHLQDLHFEDVVGESTAIKRVLSQVEQVSRTDATVIIVGETGVGKELVARAIHRHSQRQDKPFIRVHCSALPETLIPSELFGHEKGAFTGAIRRRIGRFELADGGTLFLDEIGDLAMDIQVRLLRVIQTKEFERVGGAETLRSDFRLLAATNRNLEEEVKAQRFRADLYYRLAVFPIAVPPLRERKEDIPLLAYYFLEIYSKKRGKVFTKIPDSEMQKLLEYDWPGNVRELENIIERGTILDAGPVFRVPELEKGNPEIAARDSAVTLRENERRHILWALRQTHWKVRGQGGAAELLDLPPSTLAFRMKKLGIKRPQNQARMKS